MKHSWKRAFFYQKKYETNLFLKCENLQKIGSFKFKGVLNKILSLPKSEKGKDVATSAGNHARGVGLKTHQL